MVPPPEGARRRGRLGLRAARALLAFELLSVTAHCVSLSRIPCHAFGSGSRRRFAWATLRLRRCKCKLFLEVGAILAERGGQPIDLPSLLWLCPKLRDLPRCCEDEGLHPRCIPECCPV